LRFPAPGAVALLVTKERPREVALVGFQPPPTPSSQGENLRESPFPQQMESKFSRSLRKATGWTARNRAKPGETPPLNRTLGEEGTKAKTLAEATALLDEQYGTRVIRNCFRKGHGRMEETVWAAAGETSGTVRDLIKSILRENHAHGCWYFADLCAYMDPNIGPESLTGYTACPCQVVGRCGNAPSSQEAE
jgi:hypothetical protein